VQSLSDDLITCTLPGIELGPQTVKVHLSTVGTALSTAQITGQLSLATINPSSGSIHGNQLLTVTGNGFTTRTLVKLGNLNCTVQTVSPSQLTCLTADSGATRRRRSLDNVALTVSVTDGTTVATSEAVAFTYQSSQTPSVASVSPSSGSGGTVTISGSGFGLTNASVRVGAAECLVTSQTDTQVVCELAAGAAGSFPVVVRRSGTGDSNSDVAYMFSLVVDSLSQSEGSIGGGLALTVLGQGFSSETSVRVCSDSSCALVVSENGLAETRSFVYKLSLTPVLTRVSPARGGTGGGTRLTIEGSGFADEGVRVSIGGSECEVESVSSVEIVCRTGAYGLSSAVLDVQVETEGRGVALGTVRFEYVDLWTSRFTWGGLEPPGEGEVAVISSGQHIYFDAATTPLLKGK